MFQYQRGNSVYTDATLDGFREGEGVLCAGPVGAHSEAPEHLVLVLDLALVLFLDPFQDFVPEPIKCFQQELSGPSVCSGW